MNEKELKQRTIMNSSLLKPLLQEASEITAIISASRRTSKKTVSSHSQENP